MWHTMINHVIDQRAICPQHLSPADYNVTCPNQQTLPTPMLTSSSLMQVNKVHPFRYQALGKHHGQITRTYDTVIHTHGDHLVLSRSSSKRYKLVSRPSAKKGALIIPGVPCRLQCEEAYTSTFPVAPKCPSTVHVVLGSREIIHTRSKPKDVHLNCARERNHMYFILILENQHHRHHAQPPNHSVMLLTLAHPSRPDSLSPPATSLEQNKHMKGR